MFSVKLRSLMLAVLASLTIPVGLGLSSAASASVHHSTRHHSRRHHSRIPQHNKGDHDKDNRGGPSDGDGNI